MMTRGVVPIAPGCGGAELAAYQLARSLAGHGHHVTLLADTDGLDDDKPPTLTVAPVGRAGSRLASWIPGRFAKLLLEHLTGNLAAAAAARRLCREQRFDYLHAHGSLSTILASLVCGVRVVYTEHDAPPWLCRYRSWWERLIRTAIYRTLNVTAFHCADAVGATFDSLQDDMVRRWEVAEGKVSTIVNGADVSLFGALVQAPVPSPEPFGSFCLFVGRLTPRKAPDLLLRALAQVPEVCCVLAGDGPMRPKLERLARELGIVDRVAFTGNLPPVQLAELYGRAKLLVLPSVSEALPLVVLEAMASGTPVLASRIAGLPGVVKDWETGFLVNPGDVGALAVALRFLMHDEDMRRAMGARARARVSESFVWPTVADHYEHLYRSVAPGRDFARRSLPPVAAFT
jgi:glycosyltransferase involved in cell wall biosynthesis